MEERLKTAPNTIFSNTKSIGLIGSTSDYGIEYEAKHTFYQPGLFGNNDGTLLQAGTYTFLFAVEYAFGLNYKTDNRITINLLLNDERVASKTFYHNRQQSGVLTHESWSIGPWELKKGDKLLYSVSKLDSASARARLQGVAFATDYTFAVE